MLSNGTIYIGLQSHDGLRHGQGTQMWANGTKYIGHWYNDKANGQGRLIHSDGDSYEGEWFNDMAHGFGKFERHDGKVKYMG